jgi:hypothetical protein
MLVFLVSNPDRHNFYEHFTWQASAWLEGQAGIRYPVCPDSGQPTFPGTPCIWTAQPGQPYDDFFLDVLPLKNPDGSLSGRALIPFPPLPALVLVPFVAVWGLNVDAQTLAALIGGLDVWLVWWLLGGLRLPLRLRIAATVFFGLGTVFWYTSMLGTTWYFAHVVAVAFTIIAVGLAIRNDRAAVAEGRWAVDAGRLTDGLDGSDGWADAPDAGADEGDPADVADYAARTSISDAAAADDSDEVADAASAAPRLSVRSVLAEPREAFASGRPWQLIDAKQFVAGFALGLAATARLTVIFGLPFLAFVGSGRTPLRRTLSAGLGAALPVLALTAYNVITTGHIFHPAYEYLYQQEANGYPELGYNPSWSIEDLRYVPQNLMLMLAGPPDVLPVCPNGDVRSLFSATCPLIVPRSVGMSLLLTSPAYLLGVPAVLRLGRSRMIAGAAIAVGVIAFANLMHFSQGWVQFGYRFSNDFVPFALVLVALGMLRLRTGWNWIVVLIGLSVLINAWGVAWGNILGW